MIPLEAYITSNYVKYDRLAPLIAEAFAGSSDTYLDIYIDMNSAIKSLYNSNYNTDISNYKSLTSCMINMCGHYRDYFRRYLGVNTSIYIIMSNNCNSINTRYVAEYNKSFIYKINNNKLINDLVKDNLELLNSLIPYLPNIYLIQSEFETASVISALIDKRIREGFNNPNLIISRDILNMQILSMYPKTAMLRPIKYHNNDNSYIIGPFDNIPIETYWKYFDPEISKSSKPMKNIHPINTALLMAMTGYNKRDLKPIINIVKAKDYIYNCVGSNPTKCSVKTLYELNPKLNDKVSWTVIESRYKALDILFQKSLYEDSIEFKLLNLLDLNDPVAVKRVNDKIFYDNPIDLDRL